MEYRLNKINTDVKRKLLEKTKDGKVHRKIDETKINTNFYRQRDENTIENRKKKNKETKFSEYMKDGKKITIKAEKSESIEVEATINEKKEIYSKEKGVFIDTKK